MLLQAQLSCARLCGPLGPSQVTARIRNPAQGYGQRPSLKRFGMRDNKVLQRERGSRSTMCSSTVKELTPLTQSSAGNPLARLYVALLPGIAANDILYLSTA